MKRTLACILTLALLLCALPLPLAAASAADTLTIARGLTLTTEHGALASGALRRAFTLDYMPDERTTPVVLYGQKLYGKSTVDEVVAYAASLGYTVMAAVNADFFNLETGLPTGMCIQNGRLVSSDGAWNAVGFRADGTALVGAPKLRLSVTMENGTVLPVYGLNKRRSTAGLYLYSSDFSATTRTTNPGTEVVLALPEDGRLTVGSSVVCTVVSGGAQTATPIGNDRLVLSLADANTAGLALSGFVPGAPVTVSVTAESGWEDVVWSTGGGNLLAQDGALTADAASGDDPRTVLGVRADGSFKIYVCDGRQSALSSGISTREAAQLLLNDGCVTVINLDGGGSSAVSARWPGEETSSLRNSPSDGAERACATYILFVNTGDPALPATRAAVYPRSAALLAGAQLTLSARTCNDDFFPTGAYDDLYTVTDGEGYIVGNVLTAPVFADTLTVAADVTGLRNTAATYTVAAEPAAMSLVRSGSDMALKSLALDPGEVIDLDVWASDGVQRLVSQDTQFTFSLPAALGTIDENGVLTASSVSGVSGKLTVAFGSRSAVLPVTVGRAPLALEDFESGHLWTAAAPEGAQAEAVLNTAVENSRYGHNSLHLTAAGSGDAAVFTPSNVLSIPTGAQTISLMLRGNGRTALNFATADGTAAHAVVTGPGSAWTYTAVSIPAGARYLTGVTAEGTGGTLAHDLWLDQLMLHFGAAANDVTPPTLDIQPFDGLVLTVHVRDNYLFPVEQSMISVTLDGARLPFTYDEDTGELVCQVPQSGGLHRITVAAQDYFLNYVRRSVVFGQTAAYNYGDLTGHWCADYAEYLCARGLFDAAERFNPGTKVTNAMAATLISRYLRIDTTRYADVELPYSDAADIPDWALPHVRAMYALSIMTGTIHDGQRMLLPNGSCSRAQIMTVLGRTFGRGFSYAQAQFSDFAAAPAWAQDHISLLASLGIVDGYGGATGEMRPNGTITRAEFASLLFKMY